MPTYSYDVIIRSKLDSSDVKAGGQEAVQELSRIERQARQTTKALAELQKNPGFQKIFDDQFREQTRLLREQEKQVAISARNKDKIDAQSAQNSEKLLQQRLFKEKLLLEQAARQKERLEAQSARNSERINAQNARAAEQLAFRKAESERRWADRAARDRERTAKAAADAEIRENARVAKEYENTLRQQEKAKKAFEREQERKSAQRIEDAQTVGDGLETIGTAMTGAFTLPVVAGMVYAIKIGSEYEQSMNMLQAVTNATAAEMQKAGELSIKLGNDLSLPGVSAKDVAEAMTELGKSGMTVTQAMAAVKGTLQLALTEEMGFAKAAEYTANALNMFGLEATEAGRVADLFAGAANASSSSVVDVAESLKQAGSVFAAAGVPIEDTVALIAELANQGIKGSDAGTSLKTMMQRLQSPTDNAADAMKKLNVEIYDQQGKMKPMKEIIAQFENGLKGLSQQQKDQTMNTIFGSDAVRAANIVFKQGAEGFDKIKESVMRANAAQDLAMAKTKGLAGSWKALTSQLETIGLIIFNRIKEPLTKIVLFVATVISQIADTFTNLPEGVQQAILVFTALLAAIGPVVTIIGTLIVAIASVVEGIAVLGGLATVASAIAAISIILAGLVAGLSLAAGAVYALFKAWQNGFGPVASLVIIGVAAIMSAISPIIGLPILIAAILTTIYKMFQTNFGGIRDFAKQIWNTIVSYVRFELQKMLEIVNAVGGRIVSWWRENYGLILQTVETIQNTIRNIIQVFLNYVSAFWQAHGEKLVATANWIWSNIKSYVMVTVNSLLDVIQLVLLLINGKWDEAWQNILKGTRRATAFIVGVIHGFNKLVAEAVVKIATWLYNNSGAILAKIGSMVVTGLKYLVTVIALLPLFLIKLVPKFIAAGLSIGAAIWQGIKDGLSGTSEAPQIEPFDINTIFGDVPNLNADTLTNNEPNFLDKLRKSMTELGDATKNTNNQFGNFNKSLDDTDKKSSKVRNKSTFSIQDASLPELLAAMRAGTMAQESGGKINARNQRTGALGLFQVMPENIPSWTKNTPGVGQMTVEEFRRNPEAQRKVFDKYMGEYLRRAMQLSGGDKAIAVRMAAAAWYGGPDDFRSFDNSRRFRPDEPSFREYTTKVLGRTRGALRKTRRGDGSFNIDKSFDELADESIFNNAKQRVQTLTTLAKELNVALTVSTEVTTTNQDLILQQQKELRNLEDLKKKREEVIETAQRLGLSETNYARETIAQADESLKKLYAIDEGQKLVNSTYDDSVAKLEEMRAATGGALTPLEEFNLKFERLQKNSGLSREEFEKLNPRLIETRQNLQKIADLDFEQKLSEKLKSLGEDISKEIERIQAETSKIGKTDAQKLAIDRQMEIDDYIKANKVPDNRRSEVENLFNQKYAALDAQAAVQKAADATALYTEEVNRLNEALTGNTYLTEAQKLEIELTTGKLKDLTDEQKNHLRILQQQADAQMAIKEQYSQTYDFIRGSLDIMFDKSKSFSDKLKSIFGNIFSSFKKMILDMTAEWITSKLFGDRSGGNTTTNNRGFGELFDIFKTILTGGRSNGAGSNVVVNTVPPTTTNRPSAVSPDSLLTSVGNLSQHEKSLSFANRTTIGDNIPVFTNNATPTPLGGAARDIASGLPTVVASAHRTTTPSTASGESARKMKNIFGKGGIFGEAGFGFNSGTISGLGAIGGIAGSLIGGPVGGVLMGAASGIGLMSSLASLLGISSLGGPVGLAIGAAIGGIMALGQVLFGRNKQRRADERTRNQAMLDAFAAIDKLISDVNSDKIDGASAVSQAEDIRKNYLDQMKQLKDGKTRRIALADVSRIDAKITALKAAAKSQDQRKEKLLILAPTFRNGGAVFADGGNISTFARGNFKNNPLGYITGAGSSRSDSIDAYFPVADSFAKISNSEYVLDAETTKNIGILNLDRLRAGKGKNLSDIARMMKSVNKPPVRLAIGGAVNSPSASSSAMTADFAPNINVSVETNIYPQENGAIVETKVYLDTPEGKQKIEEIVEEKIYQNRGSGKIPVALKRVNNGQ